MNSNHSINPIVCGPSSKNQSMLLERMGDSCSVTKTNIAQLILIRGLPGAGKSTKASVLAEIGYRHFEADMFFEVNGTYQYDARRIREAHDWCKQMTRQALARDENVVVSNTFTHVREMEPYFEMAAGSIQVIEAKGKWENVHGVPAEMLDRMAARWEVLPGARAVVDCHNRPPRT